MDILSQEIEKFCKVSNLPCNFFLQTIIYNIIETPKSQVLPTEINTIEVWQFIEAMQNRFVKLSNFLNIASHTFNRKYTYSLESESDSVYFFDLVDINTFTPAFENPSVHLVTGQKIKIEKTLNVQYGEK